MQKHLPYHNDFFIRPCPYRSQVDLNRPIREAAQGHPTAETAHRSYHTALAEAIRSVTRRFGQGLLLDLHGHGKQRNLTELGYQLTLEDLQSGMYDLGNSTLKSLGKRFKDVFAAGELIVGESSFGAMLGREGIPAQPSPDERYPGENRKDCLSKVCKLFAFLGQFKPTSYIPPGDWLGSLRVEGVLLPNL